MSELNSEQIKKALEWCIQSESCEYCEYKSGVDVCSIRSDALALINELTIELKAMRGAANSYKMHIVELTEEVENWRIDAENYRNERDKLSEENEKLINAGFDTVDFAIDKIKKAKIDTVRKMQTEIEARCVKGGIYPAFVKTTIDQIAKEMLEEH